MLQYTIDAQISSMHLSFRREMSMGGSVRLECVCVFDDDKNKIQ